jgi:hypothetical protein
MFLIFHIFCGQKMWRYQDFQGQVKMIKNAYIAPIYIFIIFLQILRTFNAKIALRTRCFKELLAL